MTVKAIVVFGNHGLPPVRRFKTQSITARTSCEFSVLFEKNGLSVQHILGRFFLAGSNNIPPGEINGESPAGLGEGMDGFELVP